MYGEEPAFDCNNCKFGWEIFEQTKIQKKCSKKLRTSINAQKVNLKNVINKAIVKERIK